MPWKSLRDLLLVSWKFTFGSPFRHSRLSSISNNKYFIIHVLYAVRFDFLIHVLFIILKISFSQDKHEFRGSIWKSPKLSFYRNIPNVVAYSECFVLFNFFSIFTSFLNCTNYGKKRVWILNDFVFTTRCIYYNMYTLINKIQIYIYTVQFDRTNTRGYRNLILRR